MLRITSLGLVVCALLISLAGSVWADDTAATDTSGQADTAPAPKTYKPDFSLKSADGGSSLKFGLELQLEGEFYSKHDSAADTRSNDTKASVRRLRPAIGGSIGVKELTYKLNLELAPGKLELLDLFIDYNFSPNVQLRLGVYKIPFTRYRIQSDKKLHVVDWGIVSRFFGAERQYGLMLHNGYNKPPEIAYEFGVFTGENARTSHGRGLWKTSGEQADAPNSLTNPGKLDEFHPAFAGHFSYNANGIDVRREADVEKGGFRYSLGASFVWDPRAAAWRDYTLRLAPEFLMKVAGWSLSATYYAGFFEVDGKLSETKLAMHGGAFSTTYVPHERIVLGLMFDFARSTADWRDASAARAAGLIADAQADAADPTSGVSTADADAIQAQYKNAGTFVTSYETTVGLTVFLLGELLVWRSDVSWLRNDYLGKPVADDWRVRSQMMLAF